MHQQRFDDPHHEADDARTPLAPAGSSDPALCSGPFARTIEHRFAAAPRLIPPAAILIVGYIAMVAVLVGIGEAIVHHGAFAGLRGWDDDFTRWMAGHRTASINTVTGFLSRAADTLGIVGCALVVEVVLMFQRRWRALLILPLGLGLELVTFLTVNVLVDRPRPNVARLGSEPSTSSFPSGHTAATVVLWGAVALLFCWSASHRWIRSAAVAFVVMMAVAVGTARVWRGMHHPSDVIVGGLMGLAVLCLTVLAVRVAARETGADTAESESSIRRHPPMPAVST